MILRGRRNTGVLSNKSNQIINNVNHLCSFCGLDMPGPKFCDDECKKAYKQVIRRNLPNYKSSSSDDETYETEDSTMDSSECSETSDTEEFSD